MKINISRLCHYLWMIIIVFLIIRPQCIISAYPKTVMMFAFLQAAFVVLIFFLSRFTVYNNPFIWCVLIYYFYDFVNTFLRQNASINLVFVTGIWVLFTIIIITRQISLNGVPDTINKMSISLSVFLWVNCILVFLYPDGLVSVLGGAGRFNRIFFLGQTNQLSVYFVLNVILAVCNWAIRKKLSSLYLVFSLGVWPVTFFALGDLNRSTTGMIAGVLLLMGYLFYKFIPIIRKIANPIVITLLIAVFFIGLTRILALDSVAAFIRDTLNKDVTLSERTTIWAQAYLRLSDIKTLLFGLGEAPGGAYITIWTGHTFSAHNIVLQVLLLGGLVLLSVFMYLVIQTIKSVAVIDNDKARAAISICLFVFFMMNMLEVYYYSAVFLSLYVFYETGLFLFKNEHPLIKNSH